MSAKVVGIGEVLWDMLPAGRQLGGAPANFAYHARALDAEAFVISRIGRDPLGQDVLARFRRMGLPEETLQSDEEAATGTVLVSLDETGLPGYTIKEGVAWDRLAVTSAALEAVQSADAICFGTLAQRSELSRAAIRQLVRGAGAKTLRILDLNLRQHFYTRELIEDSLALSSALKLNSDELDLLGKMFGLQGDERSRISQLASRYDLRVVACTRGAQGSLIFAQDCWSDHPGVPIQVADTVGAGDAFTAAMVLGLLSDWDLDVVNQRANEVAAHVASCAGATPELPDSLTRLFKTTERLGWA